MAHLFVDLDNTRYWDKKSGLSRDQWISTMRSSRTLYVGNISFYTSEEQLFTFFEQCGRVEKLVMGLNRVTKTPCGFCFVEYRHQKAAALAVNVLNGAILDDRGVRVDWDAGFQDGRQFGRGQTGDQWRDDLRDDFDPARGGQGRALLRSLEDGTQIFVSAGMSEAGPRGGRGGQAGAHRGAHRGGHRGGFQGASHPYQKAYMTERTDDHGIKRQ